MVWVFMFLKMHKNIGFSKQLLCLNIKIVRMLGLCFVYSFLCRCVLSQVLDFVSLGIYTNELHKLLKLNVKVLEYNSLINRLEVTLH